MRTIQAKKLTVEDFAPYGSFVNLLAPQGNNFGGFYADQVIYPLINTTTVAFSPLTCEKGDLVITKSEYHTLAGEVIVVLDDDAVFHVAPPSNKVPVPEKTEAFLVPKGTLLRLNTAVWHLAPMPVHNDVLHCLIALPERIYANDCVVVEYDPRDHIQVTL